MVKQMQGKERQEIQMSVGMVATMAKQIIYHNSLLEKEIVLFYLPKYILYKIVDMVDTALQKRGKQNIKKVKL
eukprot:5693268-Prorocentrum_lima.AAC.1